VSKAKINFEIEERNLANAKSFAARHRVSLNKLVSAYFASLGQDESPALDPSMKTLLDVSLGNLSVIDAARELNLPDGGFVLHLMREARLPLPKLPDDLVRQQVEDAREALKQCLIKKDEVVSKRRSGAKTAAYHR